MRNLHARSYNQRYHDYQEKEGVWHHHLIADYQQQHRCDSHSLFHRIPDLIRQLPFYCWYGAQSLP